MRNDYIVQKDDYKAKIAIVFNDPWNNGIPYTIIDLSILPKRKRNWKSVTVEIKESHGYYIQKTEDRGAYLKEQYLQYITEEDIQSAVNYVYEQFKPEPDKIQFR